MHRPKTERQALAKRLLGTPEEPGPLDVGWIKRRYGVEGSHIKRWREEGIPAARVDDLLDAAILALTGHEETAPPWAERLAKQVAQQVIDALSLDQVGREDQLIARLEELRRLLSEEPPEETAESDQGGVVPPELSAE